MTPQWGCVIPSKGLDHMRRRPRFYQIHSLQFEQKFHQVYEVAIGVFLWKHVSFQYPCSVTTRELLMTYRMKYHLE